MKHAKKGDDVMRLLLKILAVLILGPIVLGLLIIVGIAALVAVPIVWEQLVARLSAPPDRSNQQL
jgi:hypothetical protein